MSIILARDDLIPLMESYGMAAVLVDLAEQNADSSKAIAVLEWELSQQGIFLAGISESRLEHLVADLILAGKLTGAEIWLGSNVEGVARAAAPASLGQNSSIVWFSSPDTGTMRWYKNGILLLQKEASVEKSIVKSEQNLVSGDVVQVCQVVDGVPGWWSRIAVP